MMFRYVTVIAAIAAPAAALNIGVRSARSVVQSRPSSRQQAISIPLSDAPVKEEIKHELASTDGWVANLDYVAFGKEVTALGKQLLKETGKDDVEHLQKINEWRNIAAVLGLATVWTSPNPITIAALSTWIYASWTMIAHHTCHGGYNRVDAGRFNSRGFGLGVVNRFVDWLDWMQPEAWNVEHNRLHHYRLNERNDPDLVQRNLEFIRTAEVNQIAKYAAVAFFMPVWKWFYYAPNTFKELKINEWVKEGKELPKGLDPEEAATVISFFHESRAPLREVVKPLEFFATVLGPMLLGRYVFIPAVFLAIPSVGPTLAAHALVNLVLADLLTNVHSFVTIVTNHAGEDLYTFDDAVKPKTGSFYVRQVIGSANYATGSDMIDFSHGFLNYQIEHHGTYCGDTSLFSL
jgi:hypothetical protein